MKKYVASVMALMLLLTSVPAFAAGSTTKVIVKVNGTQVQFSDAAPLERKGSLMLPLRTIAQYLQIGITSDKKTERIVLAKSGLNVSFKTGAKEAKVGGAVVAFSPAAISVKNRVYVPISFFENVLGLTTKYDKGTHTVSITAPIAQPEEIVKDVTALLQAGEFQKLIERYFDDNLKQALPADKLVEAWKQAAGIIGRYIEVSHIFQEKIDEHIMLTEARLKFEKTSIRLILPMNSTGQLIGLVIQPVTIDVEKPHTVVEEELTIGKGTAYELGGTLTLPKGATSPVPAIVLVHGSGPNDRDETAFGFKTFRDLAYGLAGQGIAVLRYDKRTYVYGSKSIPGDAAYITVKEETVDDAILAARLLKSDKRIDPDNVYMAGHSLGGLLGPRIDAQGGDFAGLVLIAGSPRPLWEILYDQWTEVVNAMDSKDPARAATEAWVKAEYARAKTLSKLSDEEAANTTIFQYPAIYYKEMDSHSAGQYAAQLTKPVLVLQGENDFQVYADKDYVRWQELFKGKSNATFKLYPNMNHFLTEYDGPGAGTVQEYWIPGLVSQKLIDDLASWILKKSKR